MIAGTQSSTVYANNYNYLRIAAQAGHRIGVDGDYGLGGYSGANVTNLILIGTDYNTCKLRLTSSGTVFAMSGTTVSNKGTAYVKGITIAGSQTSTYIRFIYMAAPFVNIFEFRNNYITGNLRVLTGSPGTYNLNLDTTYIETLTVEDNIFYNTNCTSGYAYTFYLENTPTKMFYFRRNLVTNFMWIFIHLGITNGHTYEDYITRNINFVVEDNRVVCRDDYVPQLYGGTSGYHTFMLCEGIAGTFKNNIIDGIHYTGSGSYAVYDAYLSTVFLTFEGNTIRNNVTFSTAAAEWDLLKSKKSYDGVDGAYRIYRNNIWIVEKRYADKFNKSRFMLRKVMPCMTDPLDEYIVENNYWNCYILSFQYWGHRFIDNVGKFNNNRVIMTTCEHNVKTDSLTDFYQALVLWVNDSADRILEFKDNYIVHENPPLDSAGVGSGLFYIVLDQADAGDSTSVLFTGNYLALNGFTYGDYTSSKVTSSGNTFVSVT
jgi:hypothetical protein